MAQLRMAGIITEFAARAPDPDNGRLNRRYMTSLAAAPGVLGWGQPAGAQARAAAEAGRRWGLPVDHPAADRGRRVGPEARCACLVGCAAASNALWR
jgi:hypothetical protein